MIKNILFSLIFPIIFGIIDALFFLIAEDSLQKKLKKTILSEENAELLTGGLSASFSILVASSIMFLLKRFLKKIELVENPFFDSFGILFGTLLILSLNILIKKKR